MALINTLRKRMGKIVVIAVAFSLVAFILGEFLQSGTILMGDDNQVAEISGTDITYREFQEKIDELANIFALNNRRNPSSEELKSIREQAWNALIIEHAYGEQFDKLGIVVTDVELKDMVQGNNIAPVVQEYFANPNTGMFDFEYLRSALTQINQDPNQRQSWLLLERNLVMDRKVRKLENLLEKTIYTTTAEAKKAYQNENTNLSAEYLYVPYISVEDSLFSVSKDEMEGYLAENKERYQRDASRSVSYVMFPIEPSAEDSAMVREEVAEVRQGLLETENDSVYVTVNSEGLESFRLIVDPSELPEALAGKEEGFVTEPELQGNRYVFHKLSDIVSGGEQFVKASHILIETDTTSEATKAEARRRAQDLINQLNEGADFFTLAAANSVDRSNAQRGGDLGWFGENSPFVEPFKEAAFAFKGTGVIQRPVETQFGYHIIKIDEPKTDRAYKVATIEKELYASDQTLNEIYRKADRMSAAATDEESFRQYAQDNEVSVRMASRVGRNESRLGVMPDARGVILWLFNKAEVGDVSEVFEVDNRYVVAVMTGEQEEGTADLSQVENEIRIKVLNRKKTDYILEKLSKAGSEELEELKSAYGEDAKKGQADLTLNSNSIPGIGYDPKAVGVAFSLEEGEKTRPFAGENGVLVINALSKDIPAEVDDYSQIVEQLRLARVGRKTVIANFPLSFYPVFVSQDLHQVLLEIEDVEDNRYKFF